MTALLLLTLLLLDDPPKKPGFLDRPATAQTLDESLLFFPAKHPSGDYHPPSLTFEDATFTAADGTKLHAWYCPADNPKAVVLFCHGNAGNISHRAPALRRLQQMSVTVLAFDYRGYGKSDGTPTVPGVLQDARAARKFLAAKAAIPESDIVLLGESLGGAVAIDLAPDGARGLVLESTFSSMKDVAEHHYPRLAWLIPERKLNSVKTIAAYRGPLLQSHGDADRIIPIDLGRKLHAAAPGTKEFYRLHDADHNDPRPDAYYQTLDRFLSALPKGK